MKAVILITILALTVPIEVTAQETSAETENYIYSTYFYCDSARLEEAEALIKKDYTPIYDAAVADGTIKGWGWQAHHTGGRWRFAVYHLSNTVEGLLAALETIGNRAEKAGGGGDGYAFDEICSAHDDYIWKQEAGSAQPGKRGPAAILVYEVCSMNGQQRAKELVKKEFAPVLDKAVADGKLMSWGWNSHVLGGKYRALTTMSAKDFATLLNARAEILETFTKDHKAAVEAYDGICPSHSDYLWNVRHEKS